MLKIDNPVVYNFANAITHMRNSWGSQAKSDSQFVRLDNMICYGRGEEVRLGGKDFLLAMSLIKAGDSHAKFLRQILIDMTITGPAYWWAEMDTYKVGTTANSTSTMHTLGKRELPPSAFSFDDEDVPEVQAIHTAFEALRQQWIAAGKKKGPDAPEWRRMIQALPRSFRYTRGWTANYQVLRHIYYDRRNHRLSEWRQFCLFVETLPFSSFITEKQK